MCELILVWNAQEGSSGRLWRSDSNATLYKKMQEFVQNLSGETTLCRKVSPIAQSSSANASLCNSRPFAAQFWVR